MNQEKIGKFIAKLRKEKKITQHELGEKLGVTDKTISRWENGNYMPDLSLLKPLCKELNISINELLSGERIDKDNYQEKFEENVINTIDYTNKKITKYSNIISMLLIVFGLIISLSAITIFPSESSWGSIYSIFGIIMFTMGINRFTSYMKLYKRIILIVIIFIITFGMLIFADYLNVKMNNEPPRFRFNTLTQDEIIIHESFFYNAYSCKDNIFYLDKYNNLNEIDFNYYEKKCIK